MIVCVALLSLGSAAAQAAGTSSITGTVTAFKGGGALKAIDVTASGPGGTGSATTDVSGKYTIAALEKGTYAVSFVDPTQRYLPFEESKTILVEGNTETLNVVLKESGTITGRVTSAATGGPLPGTSVNAFVSGSFVDSTPADGNGEYTISGLSPGTYEIEFSTGGGFLSQRISTTVGEGTINVNAALREGGKITGRVTNAVTHAGLAKIGVSASESTGGFGFASTNANGEYTITGLPTGSYTVSFEWEFSEAESKVFEKAPRFIAPYITQFYSGQPSAATANHVVASEANVTPGISAAMVPSAPVNTGLPAVTGAPTVGSTLACSPGSWTGESLKLAVGWPLTSPFSYQWIRDGVAIPGSTADTYMVQVADLGHGLVCEVSATTEAGHASAKSSAFPVAKPIPVIVISASKFKVTKGALKLSIACSNATCAGSLKAIQTFVVKHRKGKKTTTKKQTVVVAAGSYSLAAGTTGTITLRLTSAGKTKLAHASHHRLTPKLVASVTGGKQLEKAVQFNLAG